MRGLLVAMIVLLGSRHVRADEGRAAIERFGCVRCHAVPGFVASAETGCTACHQALLNRPAKAVAARRSVTHFVEVPSLGSAARRLRGDWMIRYLQDPQDVRPHMDESMPRLPISAADARAIVAYLQRAEPHAPRSASPAPDPSRVARGRELFGERGCPTCHTFGNASFAAAPAPAPTAEARLAPNLRLARDRLDPATMLAWIADPTSVDPAARMPRVPLSPEEALAIRDYLILGETGAPAPPPRAPTLADIAPLARQVRFAEVRRVFARSCVHCHAKTSGRAAAGLGFSPVALDLASWRGVHAGTTLPDGTHRSVLDVPPGGGAPLLVARLLRRHEEATRDVSGPNRDTMTAWVRPASQPDAPVGMPLALPPVPAADVRVVATWIAQGARQ